MKVKVTVSKVLDLEPRDVKSLRKASGQEACDTIRNFGEGKITVSVATVKEEGGK